MSSGLLKILAVPSKEAFCSNSVQSSPIFFNDVFKFLLNIPSEPMTIDKTVAFGNSRLSQSLFLPLDIFPFSLVLFPALLYQRCMQYLSHNMIFQSYQEQLYQAYCAQFDSQFEFKCCINTYT